VEDDVEGGLEIVLGLIEEVGVDPVGFAAHGKPGMQAVVEANAHFRRKSRAAVARGLRLQVRAANKGMRPGLEAVAAPAYAKSAAAKILYMLIDVDRVSKTRDEVALDGKPSICELADRGVGADETGARPK
jgi:hypothetical protein